MPRQAAIEAEGHEKRLADHLKVGQPAPVMLHSYLCFGAARNLCKKPPGRRLRPGWLPHKAPAIVWGGLTARRRLPGGFRKRV
jgi:hypothetical protein